MKTIQTLLFFLFTFLFGNCLVAQQNTVGAGGEATGLGGTVSYTVGQIDYSSYNGSSGNVNQGVQQPLEFFNLSIGENQFAFAVLLYPNPVIAELHVDLTGVSLNQLGFTLTDATGRLIQTEVIQNEKFTIHMIELSRANYFLNFTQNSKVVQSFQIIKK